MALFISFKTLPMFLEDIDILYHGCSNRHISPIDIIGETATHKSLFGPMCLEI